MLSHRQSRRDQKKADLGTYVKGKVQAQNIGLGKQLFKRNILGSTGCLLGKWVAVVVNSGHTEDVHLTLQVAPDAAHTQDTQHFTLRVVAESWWRCASPLVLAKSLD